MYCPDGQSHVFVVVFRVTPGWHSVQLVDVPLQFLHGAVHKVQTRADSKNRPVIPSHSQVFVEVFR